jgi:hypothetical protein
LHGIARVVVTAKRTHASANLGRITDRQPFGEHDVMSVPRRRFGDQRCGYGKLCDLARIGIVILRQAEDLDRVRCFTALGWWEIVMPATSCGVNRPDTRSLLSDGLTRDSWSLPLPAHTACAWLLMMARNRRTSASLAGMAAEGI